MKGYETIKELYEAVKSGEVDESKLEIVLDNDQTSFYVGPGEDDNGNEIDNEIRVAEANGYRDIESLYPLLFPKAKVYNFINWDGVSQTLGALVGAVLVGLGVWFQPITNLMMGV